MKEQYYNEMEFQKILRHFSNDLDNAITKLESYMEMYPHDVSGYVFYTVAMLNKENIELAEEYLKKSEERFEKNIIRKSSNDVEMIKLENKIIYNKARLAVLKEDYEYAAHICRNYYDRIKAISSFIGVFLSYCNKKLNKPIKYKEENGYLYNQVINYSDEKFLDHITKHEYSDNYELEKENECVFYPNFPTDKVFEVLKKEIPHKTRIFRGLFEDEYIYKFEGASTTGNKRANYIKVIAFHNTNEFITMYPEIYNSTNSTDDLSYLREEEEKVKVITKNRIDDFNRKYGLNIDNN